MNSSDSSGWSDDKLRVWREAQQRYWEGLAELSQFKSSSVDSAGSFHAPAWRQGLEAWWGRMTPDAPPQTQDILKRLLEMGRVYLGLAEQVYGSASVAASGGEGQPALESWVQSLEQGFAHWREQLEQGRAAVDGFGLGSTLFDGWQRVIDSMQGMDAFRTVGTGGVQIPNAELWRDYLQKSLPASAWGTGDEARADLQLLSDRALAYQQAMDVYLEAYAQQGQDSVQALRNRLQQLAAEGRTVASLRELYDLWVDVSEDVYAGFSMSERYQELYGALVNAFLALKQAANALQDRRLSAAGLPTREELRLAWRRQHTLRREGDALRRQMRVLEARLGQMEACLPVGGGGHDPI